MNRQMFRLGGLAALSAVVAALAVAVIGAGQPGGPAKWRAPPAAMVFGALATS